MRHIANAVDLRALESDTGLGWVKGWGARLVVQQPHRWASNGHLRGKARTLDATPLATLAEGMGDALPPHALRAWGESQRVWAVAHDFDFCCTRHNKNDKGKPQ